MDVSVFPSKRGDRITNITGVLQFIDADTRFVNRSVAVNTQGYLELYENTLTYIDGTFAEYNQQIEKLASSENIPFLVAVFMLYEISLKIQENHDFHRRVDFRSSIVDDLDSTISHGDALLRSLGDKLTTSFENAPAMKYYVHKLIFPVIREALSGVEISLASV